MTKEELLEKGQAALGEDNLPAAREAFEGAIEAEETCAPAWYGLGQVLLREGELGHAVGCFEYAFDQDEDLPPPWTALGHLAAQEGDPQTAAQYYRNAIQLNPQNTDPWNGLGILYASQLGKPQEAARCFLRAEYLGRDRHINNTLTLFSQLAPQPFFSYRIIRDYLPLADLPNWEAFLKVTLEEALPLQAYLTWQNLRIENGHSALPEWEMWQGIVHFLMGDPALALAHLDKAQARKPTLDLMIAYYQIQCAWDFVQPEAPYLNAALPLAEKYAIESKRSGWGLFGKKQEVAPPLPPAEIIPCYYAGLIFIENDELKKALWCFERIERDFQPAAYMALWLTEELVLPKKKKEKAVVLLEMESRDHMFTEGLSVQQLAAAPEDFLQQLTFANRYLELTEAIDTLHYHAEFEGNPHDFEIQPAKDQLPFYSLWEVPEAMRDQIITDLQAAFLRVAEAAVPAELEKISAGTAETALIEIIDAGIANPQAVSLLTCYFQYQEQLDVKSRHLLDLYAQSRGSDEKGPTEELPGNALRFLLDALTQPEQQQKAGKLAHHFQAFRTGWETPPASFSEFREQLEHFVQTRPEPEPEPEEETVAYDVIGEEEE